VSARSGIAIFERLGSAVRVAVLALGAALAAGLPAQAAPTQPFPDFIKSFEAKAVAAGVSAAVYEKATAGLTPDPRIANLIVGQPEFDTPMWTYLDVRVSAKRIANGQAKLKANAALFSAEQQKYGVDPAILAAIWGIETNYGAVLHDTTYIWPIVRSLATLCWQQRGRQEKDEAEFIAALKLVQRGPLDANTLVGSWAGAIGNFQTDPTRVLQYGTDGDGDGKIDLVDSFPDALATAATHLRGLGWQPGLDWGYEVTLPAGFDYLLADRNNPKPVSFFTGKGVARANGRPFPDQTTSVFLYVPAGKDGPKFLLTPNYLVLKSYNFSDNYAMAIGHLADRLKGGGEIAAPWPRDTKFPNLAQREAIQTALIKLGLLKGASDGRLGPITQAAYARFQASHGEVADGFITLGAYEELTAATR